MGSIKRPETSVNFNWLMPRNILGAPDSNTHCGKSLKSLKVPTFQRNLLHPSYKVCGINNHESLKLHEGKGHSGRDHEGPGAE